MPGIVGLCDFRRDNKELGELLGRMSASLCHEAWYRVDRHVDAPVALGRVSLGLLNPEPQPIFSEDRTRCIAFEGELYDYGVLKAQLRSEGYRFSVDNDAEFVLHWTEARGLEGLRELNGSFLLAMWDSRTQTVVLANDRYGLRPLYYACKGNCLLFGSEVKALFAGPQLRKEIDLRAVADFFAFELLLGDKTFFSDVRFLPPASVLTFGRQGLALKRYWDLQFCEEPPADEEAVLDRAGELLETAVHRCTDGDLTAGVFLSGGLDSRTLIGAAARQQSLPVQTFTMGRETSYDMRIARQVAKVLGTDHHTLTLSPEAQKEVIERGVWLTEGMTNCIHMSISNLLPMARSHVDVVLDGIGAPLLKGTYVRFPSSTSGASDDEELVQALFTSFNTGIQSQAMPDFFADGFSTQLGELALESLREEVQRAPVEGFTPKAEYVSVRNRQPRFIAFGPVITRSQLESRAPLFDNDLVEFICSVPAKLRYNHGLHRRLLVSHYPELAGIPWDFTGLPLGVSSPLVSLVPRGLFRARREANKLLVRVSRGRLAWSNADPRMFTDYASWWRADLRDWAHGLILSPRALGRGTMNPDAVRRVVAEHMAGYRDHTTCIGILVTFELWHRMFLD